MNGTMFLLALAFNSQAECFQYAEALDIQSPLAICMAVDGGPTEPMTVLRPKARPEAKP